MSTGTCVDHAAVYALQPEAYDTLVRAEDVDSQILPAIAARSALAGATVVEVGIGTGRIGGQLLPHVARLVGLDRSPAMLHVARKNFAAVRRDRWSLLCADARRLPLPDACADLVIAGWVLGHFCGWWPLEWRLAIDAALGEMQRILRPPGTLILIESLGTGSEQPRAPSARLEQYHRRLEKNHHFKRIELRTDYLFADVATAENVIGFFFGPDLAGRVRHNRWTRVPECTGLWWR